MQTHSLTRKLKIGYFLSKTVVPVIVGASVFCCIGYMSYADARRDCEGQWRALVRLNITNHVVPLCIYGKILNKIHKPADLCWLEEQTKLLIKIVIKLSHFEFIPAVFKT